MLVDERFLSHRFWPLWCNGGTAIKSIWQISSSVRTETKHCRKRIYTENIDGILVHKYGAHIFHTSNRAVWDYVQRFATFNRFTNSPVANFTGRVSYEGGMRLQRRGKMEISVEKMMGGWEYEGENEEV